MTHTTNSQPRLRRRAWLVASALALLVPLTLASAQQAEDEFFDTNFDGGWVGTILSGKSRIPFQVNLNVEGNEGIGFLILGDQPAGTSTGLDVFAADFTKIGARQVTFRVDDDDPLRAGFSSGGVRFGTSTLKLSYKAGDDSLAGKITGGLKGKLTATRMSPARPMTKLWQGRFKAGGETIFVQLATTEDADGVIGGHARFNQDTSAVTGQRKGGAVDMAFDVDGQEVTFSGKLTTKNNKLKGAFKVQGESNKATLVPADGNGKPMKFKSVQRAAAAELVPGESSTVRVVGKNIALGAVAYTDSPDVRVTAVELESAKALSVTLATSASAAAGTAVGLRLFNADGETADKSGVLTVADGDDGGAMVDFDSQIQPIFTANCALSGCHSAQSARAGMVLAAGVAASNIVNVASSEQPNLRRVLPGNPDESYLVRKIEGGPGISGGRMPLNRTPLAQAQIDLIRLWITEGAHTRQRPR